MKQFYELYKDEEKVSPLVTQLSWTNHLKIMSACKTMDERTALKMDGTLMEVMHTVQQTATGKIEEMTQEMLKKEPMPNTEDTMERTRHLNSLKLSAEEIVIKEIVLIPR